MMQRNQSFGSPVDSRARNVAQFFGRLKEAIGKTRQQNLGDHDRAVPNQGYGQMPYHNVTQGSGHLGVTDHANVSSSAYSGFGQAAYASQAASSNIRGGNQDSQHHLSYGGGEYREGAQRRESTGGSRRHSSGSKEGDRYGSPRKSAPYRQAPYKWNEDEQESRRAREERTRREEAERIQRREERIRKEREERARREAAQREEQLRKNREEQRKREKEEQLRREREERLRREREEKIRKEREERLRREREEKLRKQKEESQRKEREERLKREREEQLRREREEQMRREREARIKREKEERLRREREEMLKRQREEHMRREREEQIRRERAREEQIRKEKERAEQIRRQREREERIVREREELLRREKEEQLRREREEQLRIEREEMIRRETEEKVRREFLEREEQIRREAVERDRLERAHASYRLEDRNQGNRYDLVDAGYRRGEDYYGGPLPGPAGTSMETMSSVGRLLEAVGVQDEVALGNILASAMQNTGLPLGPGIQAMPPREEGRYEADYGNRSSGYGSNRRDGRRDSRQDREHEESWRSRSRSAVRKHSSRERQVREVSGRRRTSQESDRRQTSSGRPQRVHSSHSTRTSDRTKRQGDGKADATVSLDELEIANQLAHQFGISNMAVAVQALKFVKQLGSTSAKDVTLLADLMHQFTENKVSLAQVAKQLPKNLADMVTSQKIDPALLQMMVNSYQAPPDKQPRSLRRYQPKQRGEPTQRPQRDATRPSSRLKPGTSRQAGRPQKSTSAGLAKANLNRNVVAKRKAINVANRGVGRRPQVRSRQNPNTRKVHIVPGTKMHWKGNRK